MSGMTCRTSPLIIARASSHVAAELLKSTASVWGGIETPHPVMNAAFVVGRHRNNCCDMEGDSHLIRMGQFKMALPSQGWFSRRGFWALRYFGRR